MPKLLTLDQIDAYERAGFVAPIEVMSTEEATALRQQLEAAERKFPHRLNAENRNNAHYEFTFMDEVAHHGRILDAVEDLIGPDILLWSTVLFIKDPNSPAHVSFHQDATYMGLEPQVGVTAWLALSEATLTTGCMLMEPGSHKSPVRDHEDTFGADNILTRGQTIQDVDTDAVVPIVLQPGQMSLHHVRTVHASAPNRGTDRRIGVAMQAYFPPDVVQTKGEDYALLVRGEDRYGNFQRARRPASDNERDGVRFRTQANERFAEILYSGAEKRRTL